MKSTSIEADIQEAILTADIQEAILTALPDNYDKALDLMAQLSANIILCSSRKPDLEAFLANVRAHYDAYLEREKQ